MMSGNEILSPNMVRDKSSETRPAIFFFSFKNWMEIL